jgi:hypothetical protein
MRNVAVGGVVALGAFFAYSYAFPAEPRVVYDARTTQSSEHDSKKNDDTKDEGVATTTSSRPVRTPTPDAVKAVYMTSWIASGTTRRDEIVRMIEETELNAIIIDVKDDTGRVSYDSQDPTVVATGAVEVRISDLDEFLEALREKGIYSIARIAVFQDPFLAPRWTDQAVQHSSGGVWKDRKGLSWIDASSRKYHDYIIALSRDAYARGFDEINLDYMRFPTDGATSAMVFPLSGDRDRAAVMKDFFKYVNEELDKDGIPVSGDVFGLVTSAADDMGIGQLLEDTLEHFDFVAPMVYPSHYAQGSFGLGNPNEVPGPIIAKAMGDAVTRARAMAATTVQEKVGTTTVSRTVIDEAKAQSYIEKLRPWLQDFDYGGDYDAADVRAQIDASEKAGVDSWMLWDPNVRYTPDALHRE